MKTFELVIAGGGLAAARAVKSYRESEGGGRIALLSEESVLPYHRPPLSKRYLRGEGELPLVEDDSFYEALDVDVLLETQVTAVDTASCTVRTADGRRLGYRKLLIATGASPRRLGLPGAELAGVHSLRTVADSQAIRQAAQSAQRAVVVGGGFIGMEAAASLRGLGLAVTLIHVGHGLFEQLGSPRLSDGLAALYRRQGVDLLLGEKVARFSGSEQLEFVETESGRRVGADLAVVGVGVIPNTEFLEDSGLALDNGILVDDRFETSAAGVHAVGDVASFVDPVSGRRRRIEHWSNANHQGTEVGKVLAGREPAAHPVPSFFSEVFGVELKVFGDTSRFDRLVEEGSLETGFLAVYGVEGRVTGAVAVGQSAELEAVLQRMIAERASDDVFDLAAAS